MPRIFFFCNLLISLFANIFCAAQKPAEKKVEIYVNGLNERAQAISYQNTDSAVMLSQKALAMSKEAEYLIGIGRSEHNLGTFNYIKANYSAALGSYFRAMAIWEKLEKKSADSSAARQLLMLKSATTGNIGNVYSDQGDLDKALEYYRLALALDERLNNKIGVARHLGNIGLTLWLKKDHLNALDYNLNALKKFEELNDETGASITMANIGSIFHSNGNYNKALYYYSKALETDKRLGRKYGIAANLGNIGSLYLKMKKLGQAEEYLANAILICDSLRALDYKKDFERTYLELDSARGNFKGALAHYKNYVAARDSITNENNVRKQTQLEMQFDFDKKQTADSVRVAEEKKVTAAELRTEKNKSYTLYGGLALVLVFAGFIFNRYKVTQKQKRVIEEQKKLVDDQKLMVEEKQKDILDSIHYAQRIQRSLMPSEKYIRKNLR